MLVCLCLCCCFCFSYVFLSSSLISLLKCFSSSTASRRCWRAGAQADKVVFERRPTTMKRMNERKKINSFSIRRRAIDSPRRFLNFSIIIYFQFDAADFGATFRRVYLCRSPRYNSVTTANVISSLRFAFLCLSCSALSHSACVFPSTRLKRRPPSK